MSDVRPVLPGRQGDGGARRAVDPARRPRAAAGQPALQRAAPRHARRCRRRCCPSGCARSSGPASCDASGDGAGAATRSPRPGGSCEPVVEALGAWGVRWIGELGDEDLDPHLLLWDMRRNVPVRAVAARRARSLHVPLRRRGSPSARTGGWSSPTATSTSATSTRATTWPRRCDRPAHADPALARRRSPGPRCSGRPAWMSTGRRPCAGRSRTGSACRPWPSWRPRRSEAAVTGQTRRDSSTRNPLARRRSRRRVALLAEPALEGVGPEVLADDHHRPAAPAPAGRTR